MCTCTRTHARTRLETDGNRPRSYDIAAWNHCPKQHTQRDTWPALSEADTLRCTNTHPWRETLTRRRADSNNCARRNRHSHADMHEEPRRHSQRCTPSETLQKPCCFQQIVIRQIFVEGSSLPSVPLDVGRYNGEQDSVPALEDTPRGGSAPPTWQDARLEIQPLNLYPRYTPKKLVSP